MSGHSHWAGIKHRKGINDAKRGKIFTKFGKLITIAARDGGGDPNMNFQLRLAIDRARAENMPKDTIDRAVKAGTGALKDANQIQEALYEAYGPGQVAMLIKTATDNKNRTQGEIRTILMKNGGKIVPAGSVSFLFKHVGAISLQTPTDTAAAELELKAIEAGAEDTQYEDGTLTIYTKMEDLRSVKEALEKESLVIADANLIYAPLQKADISSTERTAYEKLLELLDDQDDVQEIYDNL
jgi:YebC/PmpR family DNA-binding regulatory protein